LSNGTNSNKSFYQTRGPGNVRETIWIAHPAEVIQKYCSRYSEVKQSSNEVGVLLIVPALSEETLSQARNLFREYATMPGVAPCIEDFEKEVASLPGAYAPPAGRLLLTIEESPGDPGEAAGCAALRRLEQDACEMKRLYVRPAFRGKGVGQGLVNELIAEARSIGYQRMLLDTLPSMNAAHQLYRTLGFREIPCYQKNPIPGALFFELALR
jgi:GNAT superfamily N-acetyltransferase